MKAERARLHCWRAVGAIVLAASLTSCGLVPVNRPPAAGTLTLPAVSSSELIVISDQGTSTAMRTAGELLIDSAHAREHVIIIGDRGGVLLGSSVAPAPPSVQAPTPPAPLPADPTSFQKARYSQAAQHYQKELQQARQSLRNRQHAELTSWMQGVAIQAESRARQRHAGPPDIAASLGEAAADLSSLRQSGSGSAGGETIVIIGVNAVNALYAPSVSASLQGSTVIVDDFPGTDDEGAAWQAALDQNGARRTVILTPATGNQLTATVQQGLDGAVADTLSSVLFGLGRSTLEPAALPQLRRLLRLLTVTYPEATATIDGYTDSLPAPGGNLRLSLRRAQEVVTWLVANKVPASRLQAVGCGDSNPVAPDTPDGQPLNRRVVVVIDPVTGSLSELPAVAAYSIQTGCSAWMGLTYATTSVGIPIRRYAPFREVADLRSFSLIVPVTAARCEEAR